MFDILFSFSFIWIALVIAVLSLALSYFCFFLQHHFQAVILAEWLSEHVYCPLLRVFLIMVMAFLLYPLMMPDSDYEQLAGLFLEHKFLVNMLNILFLASLLFSFLPLLSHPAIGLPLLSCIATGIFFKHQYALPHGLEFHAIPSPLIAVKIIALMLLSYWITGWMNRRIAQWLDLKLMLSDSENLVADINYLIFQMPIVLAYGQGLIGNLDP